jgi:hypothetical protein
MKITVKYPAGHTIESEWLKTGWFCLTCGKQEVWCEQGEGDYEYGPSLICTACDTEFTMQGPYSINSKKLMHAFGKSELNASFQTLQTIRQTIELERIEE